MFGRKKNSGANAAGGGLGALAGVIVYFASRYFLFEMTTMDPGMIRILAVVLGIVAALVVGAIPKLIAGAAVAGGAGAAAASTHSQNHPQGEAPQFHGTDGASVPAATVAGHTAVSAAPQNSADADQAPSAPSFGGSAAPAEPQVEHQGLNENERPGYQSPQV
ncbi:hypothetical protein [Helcobacillus massiliensis]|uniref:hypothetical protein n=1 Tax=Helcobacillus massiliensis TaxID=521392 RepID=UPI002555AE58|nr:hypothetical protein [Helcobacillus massiliensis]MDK7743063.1 hypothetical protein [Helcobacillus massiliensis]WOO92725.1 hypothetical protein R3I40_09970 [Helcobacillus massiliensis]